MAKSKLKSAVSGKDREKIGKNLKFPSISRLITDVKPLMLVILILIVVSLGLQAFILYKNVEDFQKLDREKKELISKIDYWKGIVNKYENYRDGYFKLAVLEYKIGDIVSSREYLKKTLELDPNFDEGKKLEKRLRGDSKIIFL